MPLRKYGVHCWLVEITLFDENCDEILTCNSFFFQWYFSGKTVLVVPTCVAKDPAQLVTLLEKYEVERLFFVPTALKTLLIYLSLKRDRKLLKKLKLWITAGEILSASLVNEFFDYFPENEYLLCNSYGSTELHDISYFLCRGKEQLRTYTGSIPIGRPIYNTAIYILDDDRKPVEKGQIGEMFVSSVSLASGYVNGRDEDRFCDNHLTDDPSMCAHSTRNYSFAMIKTFCRSL